MQWMRYLVLWVALIVCALGLSGCKSWLRRAEPEDEQATPQKRKIPREYREMLF
jgi:cell division protein FtsL